MISRIWNGNIITAFQTGGVCSEWTTLIGWDCRDTVLWLVEIRHYIFSVPVHLLLWLNVNLEPLGCPTLVWVKVRHVELNHKQWACNDGNPGTSRARLPVISPPRYNSTANNQTGSLSLLQIHPDTVLWLVVTSAFLNHKDTAQGTQSPLIGAFLTFHRFFMT